MQRVVSTKRPPAPAPTPQHQTVKGGLREFRFAMAYLKDPNAKQAAIAVGLAPKSAHTEGGKLLRKPEVKKILAQYRARIEARTNVTVDGLVKELAKVAFATMQDYWTVDADGQPHVDFSQLTPEQWAAIGEISVEEYMDGPTGRERPVRRTKFKLHDKLAAIEKCMRHLGAYAKDSGGGDVVAADQNNTVTYTLNIGNANIIVRKGEDAPAPKLIEG